MQLPSIVYVALLSASAAMASAIPEPAVDQPSNGCCSLLPYFDPVNCLWDSCTPQCNNAGLNEYDLKRCLVCCSCYSGCQDCLQILNLS